MSRTKPQPTKPFTIRPDAELDDLFDWMILAENEQGAGRSFLKIAMAQFPQYANDLLGFACAYVYSHGEPETG